MLVYLLLSLCVGIVGGLITWLIYELIDIYYDLTGGNNYE